MGKAAVGLPKEREGLAVTEEPVEAALSSAYLHQLPFLWLSIEDEPGPL
jgi:hypothetical protein